jgi:predicted RNA-binding Zn ribbon-like protein
MDVEMIAAYILLSTERRVKARRVRFCGQPGETSITGYTGCIMVWDLKGGNRMVITRSIESEFRFNSGRLSSPSDMIASTGASARWLKAAGLFSDAPALSGHDEARLLELREAIWQMVTGAMHGKLPERAVSIVNRAAKYPLGTPQLNSATGTVSVVSDDPLATAISIIARDAIDLVTGPLRMRVKACDQPDCRMLFVDTSPSGQRRWCSMQRCGSRAKAHAFKRKQEGHARAH